MTSSCISSITYLHQQPFEELSSFPSLVSEDEREEEQREPSDIKKSTFDCGQSDEEDVSPPP